MAQLIAVIIGLYIVYIIVKWILTNYYLLMKWMFLVPGPYALGGGCLAMSAAVLVNYLRAMNRNLFSGTGWADSPTGPEPAFRQYFFRKAYHDYAAIVRDSSHSNQALAMWIITRTNALFTDMGWAAVLTWPLGVLLYGLVAAGSVVAAVLYVAFGATHLVLVIVLSLLALVTATLFRVLEYASMVWRRIFLVCPNAGCYRKIGLPIYVCTGCGAEHKRLLPGPYGTFRRRCRCGQKLPTLFLFGRSRLPAFCPHEQCRRPLSAAIGTARNLHVPVVGGPAAGKTSFLMANMVELHACAASAGLALTFPESQHERLFEDSRRAFADGRVLTKTAEYSPDAFLVNLADARRNRALLYVYDAAGEAYQQRDVLRSHDYYAYSHAILFLVDPFSLPRVQTDYQSTLGAVADAVRPSAERPQDVYGRMIDTLRRSKKGARSLGAQPIAVVVTKTDAFDLTETFQALAAAPARETIDRLDDDPESRAVRRWLLDHGEGNLVRSLEQDFKNVRFFHCSALGRMPDKSGARFRPRRALAPLSWALGTYGIGLPAPGAQSSARERRK